MSNVTLPKEQQTAYERWEMASFSDGNHSVTGEKLEAARPKQKPATDNGQIAKIFEDARKEAYSKGLKEGFAVGMAKAREAAQDDVQHFLQLMTSFSDALEQSDEKIAEDVLSLALDIAKVMLKNKLNVDTKALLPVVLDAIHYLPQIQKPARILAHRDDVQMLRDYLADDMKNDHWQVQEDSKIERGGCQVETGTNQVDARNEMRWKRITEALSQTNDWLLP